jgi:hypothetical protein
VNCTFNHPGIDPRPFTDAQGRPRCRECNREANLRWRNGQTRTKQIVQLQAQIDRRDVLIESLRRRLLRFGVAA